MLSVVYHRVLYFHGNGPKAEHSSGAAQRGTTATFLDRLFLLITSNEMGELRMKCCANVRLCECLHVCTYMSIKLAKEDINS